MFVALVWALGLSACGYGLDNVAACKRFVKSVQCGTIDLSVSYDCDGFQVSPCDLAPFFSCLRSKYVCVGDQYDRTALASTGECSSLNVCPK
jgi:hypothetical protein